MNINRDYLIINDVKKSNVKLDNGSMFFYITDKNTQNIFVNLVINVSKNDLIQKYANIENAEDYTLMMNIVKPDNTYKIIEGKLHDKEKAIFEFDLKEDCVDKVGTYRCELLTKCNINDREEITTSNKLTYKVKTSVLNDLDDIVEAPEYPLVIQLFDKLSDINQYEEDRRANELARQLAEEQRQAKHNELVADMTDSIQAMDDKVVDIENRISAKEQAVDKLIVDTKADIDEYKVAKDQEIDDYKVAKDTEINNAITTQDNKINEFINERNDRLNAIEAKNTEQDNRLDIAENRLANIGNDITNTMQPIIDEHISRLDSIEAIDVSQNNRLDNIEAKNQEQDDRLLDIEKVNKRQDKDLKCLFTESKNNMIDITEEGNSIYLQNSTTGYTLIDEIKGNTLVNCNKEPNKELILNGNINTGGDNTVTITEGVDGGLVDVALEGNTLVNVSKTKDSTAITKAYTVENSGNHIALQGDVDGNCRPVITGSTLVNLCQNKGITNHSNSNLYGTSGIGKINLTEIENGCKYTTNSNTNSLITVRLGSHKVMKPSTTYTLIFEIVKNTLNFAYKGITVCGSSDPYFGRANALFHNPSFATTVGVKKISFTTPSDISNYTGFGYGLPAIVTTEPGMEFVIKNTMLLEGNYTNKPIPDYFTGLQSSFEDNLVTQGMVDSGEEVADNLGKYRVDYKSTQENGTVGNVKTLYLNSPLLEGDTIEEKDGDIYHVHRSELVPYTEGDEASLITDKVNTLHGLVEPTYELIEQSNLVIPSYANGHLDFNTAIPVEKVEFKPFSEELTYLYANTQYTVQFISTKAILVDYYLGGALLLSQNIVKGLNRISITTPSELVDNKLTINGNDTGANIMEVVVTDTDRKFGYFEGMKSVGECEDNVIEIVSQNKNLFNGKLYSGWVSDNGVVDLQNLGSSDNILTDYIKVEKNKTYINNFNFTYVWAFDENKKFIELIGGYGDISPKNVRNATYAIFGKSVSSQEIPSVDTTTVQIEEGLTTTGYIPHQSNNQTLTHEPLRAVGGVKDRYILIDGKWYIERNCGKYVMDGTDDSEWRIHGISTKQCTTFHIVDKYFINKMVKKTYVDNYDNRYFMCDKLPISKINNPTFNQLLIENSGSAFVWISLVGNLTIEQGKQWLINNPITIYYALETPIYEPIDYNPLEVYSGTTRIATNSTIPTNITVKNHGFNCLLKPSTTYTISSNLGLNTVTTPSVLTEDCLRFYDTDTSDVTTMKDVLVLEGDWTTKPHAIPANFSGIESAFEQEYDAEKGEYKVNVKVTNEDKSKENNITFYINEPLRGVGDIKDKVFIENDKVVVQRNCGIRLYEDGDFGTYLTDKVDTVYPLTEPTYEEVEYNDTKLLIESFKNSTLFYNSNIPVTSKLYYSYSVPIVDKVSQTANISDQQDSMIIDLATQVAVMEMMLM